MALILVSGLPCSGRTRRSKELVNEFQSRIALALENDKVGGGGGSIGDVRRVVHLTNTHANVERSAFTTQAREKPARAAFLSLGMRSVARDAIVICDGGAGLNIKGFRYQLWCAAREVGVRCVSVLCVAKPDTCRRRNEAKRNGLTGKERKEGGHADKDKDDDGEAYDEATFEELLMRFEEPNAMTRWDSPLFVLDCNGNDNDSQKSDADQAPGDTWEEAPMDAIWEAAVRGELKRAPDVVAPVRATTTNYLSLLESTSQLVLSALQTLNSAGMLPEMGGQVTLAITLAQQTQSQTYITLNLPAGKRAPTTAILQRLRRQFIKMHASSAASQNEIGFVMEQEARRAGEKNGDGGGGIGNGNGSGGNADVRRGEHFRAQRKIQQHNAGGRNGSSAQNSSNDNVQRTAEEEIAHRFVAYLEESL